MVRSQGFFKIRGVLVQELEVNESDFQFASAIKRKSGQAGFHLFTMGMSHRLSVFVTVKMGPGGRFRGRL